MTNSSKTFENKFTKLESDCWEWNAALHEDGYGMFYCDNKNILAHRYSFELYNHSIPKGFCVCHRCDNPKCVNPDHLFLGTHKDNMQDMVSKGRKALMTRDNNTETKIFTKDIKTIKELYGKEKVTNIAKMFNVSRQAIYRAVKKYEGVTI
jgi:hypothetical protein